MLRDNDRAQYVPITDDEAVDAFEYLSRTEGIIPAIESAHAVAYAMKLAPKMRPDQIIIVTLSGRGDFPAVVIKTLLQLPVIEERRSMTKIKNSFANGKAFIPFITCGDPSLVISEQLVYAMEAAGVLDGNEILIVQVVPRPQHPDDSAKLGERLPVNISAMGKCLTAFGEDALPQLSLYRGTSYAIREEDLLKQNLAVIRHKGYALDDEENTLGWRCLAVPICVQNKAIACLGTSASIKTLSRRKMGQIVNSLKSCSRLLSNKMMEK